MINYDGLFNKEYYGDKLKSEENFLSRKKLYAEIIENGTILPYINYITPETPAGMGGIVDAYGNFIEKTFMSHDSKKIYAVNGKIPYKNETVIYFGMLVNVWGHCLTDNIKRLWFFLNGTYKKYFKNCRIVYLPMWRGIITNFARLLEVTGFDVNSLQPVNEPTQFKEIVIPDVSFFDNPEGGLQYTLEYRETIERARRFALKNFSPLPNKKFYFFHGRNQFGEMYLANYLQSKGYDIVNPLNHSLDEQLNILLNCENFASSVGSISHNTLFLKDGTETLFIPRTTDGCLNSYQKAINHMRNLKVFYVDSALSIFIKDHTGPYCYIVSENLRKHFGEEITEKFSVEDIMQFAMYTNYANSEGLKPNETELRYFEKFLPEFIRQMNLKIQSTR